MIKYSMGKAFFALSGLLSGILLCLVLVFFTSFLTPTNTILLIPNAQLLAPKEVIGFLPYWLLGRAKSDYSPYITTLTYFALRIHSDGSIQKLLNSTEEEPGWNALISGKADTFLQNAKKKNVLLSLAIDSGDIPTINAFVANPTASAKNLLRDVVPIIKKYQFNDLNLDIEYTQVASSQAQIGFTNFVKDVKTNLPNNMTLTIEISTVDVIRKQLIDIKEIGKYANHVVLMAYDFHAPDSFVTGPVAPLSGAGISSEYDVETAVQKAVTFLPKQKLILGIPLYGYEWETLGALPRSAVIPGSSVVASSQRVETFLASCATCSATVDRDAQESYFSYLSDETNTNHIFFFPTENSTKTKIAFADQRGLAGLALWALGYEGEDILNPLASYKNE